MKFSSSNVCILRCNQTWVHTCSYIMMHTHLRALCNISRGYCTIWNRRPNMFNPLNSCKIMNTFRCEFGTTVLSKKTCYVDFFGGIAALDLGPSKPKQRLQSPDTEWHKGPYQLQAVAREAAHFRAMYNRQSMRKVMTALGANNLGSWILRRRANHMQKMWHNGKNGRMNKRMDKQTYYCNTMRQMWKEGYGVWNLALRSTVCLDFSCYFHPL